MEGLIIPISLLGAKVGKPFVAETAKYAQAETAIWEVSVRARSASGRKWGLDPDVPIPEGVVAIVLAASFRVFKNPSRYLTNQAGQFMGTHAQSEFTGDIFLQAERDELEAYKTNSGMWTQSFTRADDPGEFTGWAYDGNGGDPIMYGNYPEA